MSNRLLSAVWRLPLSATEKVVLAALADCADDEGVTWIAVRSLRGKMDLITMTSLGERAIQGAIKALCAAGHLKRDEQPGRGCTYTVQPRTSCAPAADAPPQEVRPAANAEAPAADAGETSTTPQNSPKASPSSRKRAAQPSAFVPPSDIPEAEWDAFEEMRRRIKKPMTDKARTIAVDRLRRLAADGWPPGDVLNHSTLNNYQGLFPPKDNRNGQRSRDNDRPRSRGLLGAVFDAEHDSRAGAGF